MDINIDAIYNILNQNQGDVNDAMGLKKKTVVVTSDPLALITEKTKVSKKREKVVVSSDSKGSDADDFTSSRNRPPMLNKENYVPWSSRLLWHAKSRPNGKLIHNSIINGPYVRRMILEPGDPNCEVPVNETFHVQTDDELTEKELKQIEADDQAI
nr:ribonuclease H-like domain-containing protein [Tanacetum cinerariifolium]